LPALKMITMKKLCSRLIFKNRPLLIIGKRGALVWRDQRADGRLTCGWGNRKELAMVTA
jgi:hypothetical protein